MEAWKQKIAKSDRPIKLVHVLTNDVDWGAMDEEAFFSQDISHLPAGKKETELKMLWRVFKLWNKVYNIPYFQYRERLKRIGQMNFDKMNFDLEITWKDVREFSRQIKDECYMMVSDDDDWYDPSLSTILPYTPIPDLCVWTDIRIDEGYRWSTRTCKNGQTLWTNNWAMKRSVYQQVPDLNALKYHVSANTMLRRSKKEFKRKFIPEIHSLTNKTVASHSRLKHFYGMRDRDIIKEMEEYKKRFRNTPTERTYVHPKAKWAQEETEENLRLTRELFGKFKLFC